MRGAVRNAMSQAYASGDPKRARQLLENLARSLEREHPGAAASLREGLEETLTVMASGIAGVFSGGCFWGVDALCAWRGILTVFSAPSGT